MGRMSEKGEMTMGDETQGILVDILENGIDVHRCAAARTLAQTGGAGVGAALAKALLDEDPDVRTDAAASLGTIQDLAQAGALMENLIGDPEADVKKEAIRALVAMRYAPVLPLLRKLGRQYRTSAADKP